MIERRVEEVVRPMFVTCGPMRLQQAGPNKGEKKNGKKHKMKKKGFMPLLTLVKSHFSLSSLLFVRKNLSLFVGCRVS